MVQPEFGRRFDGSQPPFGTLLVSQKVRTNFQALERGNELRPVLGTVINPAKIFALFVEAGSYAIDGQSTKFWAGSLTPDYGTTGWPLIVNPGQYRTDTVVINPTGSLIVSIGTESPLPSPLAASYPSDVVPIAEVTILQGVEFQPTGFADDSFVTIRDVRPMYVISAAGFGINPKEETQLATSGGQTLFTFSTITYTPGNSEINVYVGGDRKNVGEDYTETSTTSITFNLPGLPLNEKVTVWKVGAASAHRLADLDDVDVPTADAVIDPLSLRTFPANNGNPFATLADVSNVVGTIPFGAQHDPISGVHGPTVTINNTQTADSPTLSITKSNIGGSIPVVFVNNPDSASALRIDQVGAAPSILLQQFGSDDALQISYLSTAANVAPVAVLRTVSTAREPLITLRANTTGGLGANISVFGNELTFANESNVRTFAFEVGTASLTITGTSTSNRLNINNTTTSTSRSIRVVHLSTNTNGAAVEIQNAGNSTTLVLNNTSTKTIQVVRGTGSFYLDPLWGRQLGLPSYADTYHTHLSSALNDGTGIALANLIDVTSTLSEAVRDTANVRITVASSTNPLATMADIQNQIPNIKTGTYTGNGTTQGVNVGFQPDWVQLYNDSDNTQSGVFVSRSGTSSGRYFKASGAPNITVTSTGFTVNDGTPPINQLASTYRYIVFKSNP